MWDILWLKQQGVDLPVALVPVKVADYGRSFADFRAALDARVASLVDDPAVRAAFLDEMRRFLPPRVVNETLGGAGFCEFITGLIQDERRRALAAQDSTEAAR